MVTNDTGILEVRFVSHPSPWLGLVSPLGWATQYRAFSRRCSLNACVTWARGSTAREPTNYQHDK